MTRTELIFDALTILTQSGITDESRIDRDYLGYKIDQKRAKEIRDTYKRNPVIEPVWLQDFGIFTLSSVNKAEDRTISLCDCKFSKYVLPPVVMINDPLANVADIGTFSIRGVNGDFEYHYMTVTKLNLLTSDNVLNNFKFYTKVGNAIYLTPEALKARAILILESPLNGYVLDNSYILSGSLVSGTIYEVASGAITYNSVIYHKAQTFTATSTATFTGSGKVVYQNQKRVMTNDDQYPMSQTMAEVVLMKLFTQDYGIEAKQIADIKNNAQDQLRVLTAGV